MVAFAAVDKELNDEQKNIRADVAKVQEALTSIHTQLAQLLASRTALVGVLAKVLPALANTTNTTPWH
eukprot:1516472-Prymnesium_polylepis.2